MRKAAGIILIVLSIFQIVSMIMVWIILGDYRMMHMHSPSLWPAMFGFLSYGILIIALFVTGGILCLKKKYWELCLTLALFAFVIWILRLVRGEVHQLYYVLGLLATWRNWLGIGAMIISIIFIVSRKKEWSEISA